MARSLTAWLQSLSFLFCFCELSSCKGNVSVAGNLANCLVPLKRLWGVKVYRGERSTAYQPAFETPDVIYSVEMPLIHHWHPEECCFKSPINQLLHVWWTLWKSHPMPFSIPCLDTFVSNPRSDHFVFFLSGLFMYIITFINTPDFITVKLEGYALCIWMADHKSI